MSDNRPPYLVLITDKKTPADLARQYHYHKLRQIVEHPGSWGMPRQWLVETIIVLLDRIEDDV